MHDFDVYTLLILEQERQRALSKHLELSARLRQIKASQPPRHTLPTVRTCFHTLLASVRALQTRLSLPRPTRQDKFFSVQDSVTLDPPETIQVHDSARHAEQRVAAGP
jgi:hypothetical protein